jgi:hypothetical protein
MSEGFIHCVTLCVCSDVPGLILAQFGFLYHSNCIPERSPIPTESGEDEVFRHEVIP